MWEFCVTFSSTRYAKEFKNKIIGRIKGCNGIVTVLTTIKYSKVLIAIEREYKGQIKSYLTEKIAEFILLFYKKEYIISKLNFLVNKTNSMQVFLTTLVCFDSEIDKKIIMHELNLKNMLMFDSFINFKLGILKSKWDELVCLANDNIMYYLSEDTFLELIKFLISNLDYRCCEVNVFSKKDCYFLCDMQGNTINDFLVENNILYDDGALLKALIALNPEKIVVHGKSFLKDKIIKTLCNYFSSRVVVFN